MHKAPRSRCTMHVVAGTRRLKNVWEGLLSKATLVGHYEGQNTYTGRMFSSGKGGS